MDNNLENVEVNSSPSSNRQSISIDPLAELEAVTTAYIETITPSNEEPLQPWGEYSEDNGAVNSAYDYNSEGNQDNFAADSYNQPNISNENNNPKPEVPYVLPVGNVVKLIAHSRNAKPDKSFKKPKNSICSLLFY